jgi:hypothetical protein
MVDVLTGGAVAAGLLLLGVLLGRLVGVLVVAGALRKVGLAVVVVLVFLLALFAFPVAALVFASDLATGRSARPGTTNYDPTYELM